MIDELKHWCASQSNEVYGWLGFMLSAALVNGIGSIFLFSALWVVLLAARSGLTWYALWALPLVVLGLLALWLLSLLARLRHAPWVQMLLLAGLESWFLWGQISRSMPAGH